MVVKKIMFERKRKIEEDIYQSFMKEFILHMDTSEPQ